MYSDKRLCRKLENRIQYAMGNATKAKKMMREKRTPQEVYCQLRSVYGGLKKVLEKFFPEIISTDLNLRIFRLLQHEKLTATQSETLIGISKQLMTATLKKLLSLERDVQKIESLLA